VIWSATGAVANFTGGAMLDHLGLRSLFYLPAAILGLQLGLAFYLHSRNEGCPDDRATEPHSSVAGKQADSGHGGPVGPSAGAPVSPHSQAEAKTFLGLAWLANPFAYVAINTLVAVIPGLSTHLGLSTMQAGFCCSVWCFGRLGAFVVLWLWPRWHYRFGWLSSAYTAMVASFAFILIIPNLAVLVVAQLLFGCAVGLIYYSSLFYSMDVGDTKGEHGGIHEAAIGLGNGVGPAVGAAALHFLPAHPHSGAGAVCLLLLAGLAGLFGLRRPSRRVPP
jgi:hypothetical protein